MNNLSAHHYREALELLMHAGVTSKFMSADSPEDSPVELLWSRVKALPRKAEALTDETLLLTVGDAHSRITR